MPGESSSVLRSGSPGDQTHQLRRAVSPMVLPVSQPGPSGMFSQFHATLVFDDQSLTFLGFQHIPAIPEKDFYVWTAFAVGLGAIVGKVFEAKGVHLTFGQHRLLAYLLIFPLLVILPICLLMGWQSAVGPIVGVMVGLYLVLFHVVGAACPECGARLRNVRRRRFPFGSLRQLRYRCSRCDFKYDRFDSEDPPF